MDKQYLYGVIFYNERTEQEIAAWFEASSWFEARRIAEPYSLPGFTRGDPIYIEPRNREFYTVPLAEIAQHIQPEADAQAGAQIGAQIGAQTGAPAEAASAGEGEHGQAT